MLVFLVLSITTAHTIFWRRIGLFLMALFFFYSGEFISTFCFFSGALLAELSLILRGYSTTTKPAHFGSITSRHWPVGLVTLSLFLATMPPNDPDRVAW